MKSAGGRLIGRDGIRRPTGYFSLVAVKQSRKMTVVHSTYFKEKLSSSQTVKNNPVLEDDGTMRAHVEITSAGWLSGSWQLRSRVDHPSLADPIKIFTWGSG